MLIKMRSISELTEKEQARLKIRIKGIEPISEISKSFTISHKTIRKFIQINRIVTKRVFLKKLDK